MYIHTYIYQTYIYTHKHPRAGLDIEASIYTHKYAHIIYIHTYIDTHNYPRAGLDIEARFIL